MTTERQDLPPLRDVIARHKLAAQRRFGQNFLLDLNLTGRIARAAGDLTQGTVVEIGPGPGGLTRALLAAGAARVIAIEKDRRCIAALEELHAVYPDKLTLIEGDALGRTLGEIGEPPRRVVANLPYNVATALLVRWLSEIAAAPDCVVGLTLMFQKEVAARLTAAPRSKAYGRLSVLTQWLTEAERLFDVPPRAFTPAPKVTSTLIRLAPRRAPLFPASLPDLERITAAAFGQRRKMLRQSLKALGPDAVDLIDEAGLDGTARAEELDIADFCALARALAACE